MYHPILILDIPIHIAYAQMFIKTIFSVYTMDTCSQHSFELRLIFLFNSDELIQYLISIHFSCYFHKDLQPYEYFKNTICKQDPYLSYYNKLFELDKKLMIDSCLMENHFLRPCPTNKNSLIEWLHYCRVLCLRKISHHYCYLFTHYYFLSICSHIILSKNYTLYNFIYYMCFLNQPSPNVFLIQKQYQGVPSNQIFQITTICQDSVCSLISSIVFLLQDSMEHLNTFVADCLVVSCCCNSLVLQIAIFIFLDSLKSWSRTRESFMQNGG